MGKWWFNLIHKPSLTALAEINNFKKTQPTNQTTKQKNKTPPKNPTRLGISFLSVSGEEKCPIYCSGQSSKLTVRGASQTADEEFRKSEGENKTHHQLFTWAQRPLHEGHPVSSKGKVEIPPQDIVSVLPAIQESNSSSKINAKKKSWFPPRKVRSSSTDGKDTHVGTLRQPLSTPTSLKRLPISSLISQRLTNLAEWVNCDSSYYFFQRKDPESSRIPLRCLHPLLWPELKTPEELQY